VPLRRPGGVTRPPVVHVAALLAVGAVGVLLMTAGNALARSGEAGDDLLFWLGFLLIVVPPAVAIVGPRPSRGARVTLLVGVGFLLYLTKVLHDPFAFTFSDELLHLSNTEQILREGALFPENPILPVSVYYPGLASLTAALSIATGLGAFPAGLIVIGAARTLLMLSLFLLFERLTGSARLASVAGFVYIASPNFLFWTAQFSYQSLALPLAGVAALAVVMRGLERDQNDRQGWTVLFMVLALAVVMTHHLTGYALVATLVAVSLAALAGFGRAREAAWALALFTAVAAAVWLFQVAPIAGDYLGTIFGRSFGGVADTVAGTSEARRPFRSSEGEVAPLWERVTGYVSVLLLALALPMGLFRILRRRRRSAFLVVAGAAGAAFMAILPLRLVPSAWETANRASDFLFVGIGLGIALAALHLGRDGRATAPRRAAAAVFIAVVTIGGALVGWPPSARLSQPYEVRIGDRSVQPPGVALAHWSRRELGPGNGYVADESNGRMLLAYGQQRPFTGRDGLARYALESTAVTPELRAALRENGVAYAAVDRRRVSRDALQGIFFARPGQPLQGRDGYLPPERTGTLDRPDTDRLFDSGDVVVYGVAGLYR